MPRQRTQKIVSRRIDLNYFKHLHRMRTSRFILALVFFTITAVCMAYFSRKDDRMENPGPVITAHALWQNDCTACHTGNSKDGFSKTVADSACLKCHADTATIHNKNQIRFLSMATTKPADSHPWVSQLTSSHCTACHVEHRGHATMISAGGDANCTICHADISKNSKVTPVIANSVTRFAPAKHPPFGREMGSVDLTKLKFNHKYHNGVKGLENNCIACHALTADGKNIQPISYANHCARCHTLNIPDTTMTLAHTDLSVVRDQLIALPTIIASEIHNDPQKDKKLKTVETVGRPPRVRHIEKIITEQQYVDQQLTSLAQTIDKQSSDSKDYAELKKAIATSQPTTAPSSPLNEQLVEHFVVYSATNSCTKCHDASGTPGSSLATLPVNMPQRWYPHSVFDHRAHQEMSCIDCHSKATTSTLTSDILSPNIDTKTLSGKSCLDCHHADNRSGRGAASNCIACHNFHERTAAHPTLAAVANQ